jgi:uncharacterized protein YjbJ (UPF0337 family)
MRFAAMIKISMPTIGGLERCGQVRSRDAAISSEETRQAHSGDRRSIVSIRSNRMNWDMIKGDWKQLRGKVKEQWGKLTDDDLDQIEGKRDQLVGAVQRTYGIAQDDAERQLQAFESKLHG